MTNMNQLLQTADQIARQTDRWWVAALFVLLIAFVALAGRWLVKKHETLIDQQRADQQQYAETLLNLTADMNKTVERNTIALQQNTSALQDNNNQLRHFRR